MSEQQFGGRIRQALNQGTRLDARITERLRAAREAALERRRIAPAGRPVPELDWRAVPDTGLARIALQQWAVASVDQRPGR